MSRYSTANTLYPAMALRKPKDVGAVCGYFSESCRLTFCTGGTLIRPDCCCNARVHIGWFAAGRTTHNAAIHVHASIWRCTRLITCFCRPLLRCARCAMRLTLSSRTAPSVLLELPLRHLSRYDPLDCTTTGGLDAVYVGSWSLCWECKLCGCWQLGCWVFWPVAHHRTSEKHAPAGSMLRSVTLSPSVWSVCSCCFC